MKKILCIITFALVGTCFTSCAQPKIDLTGATYRVMNPEMTAWTVYELTPDGQKRLEAILESQPTYDVRAAADMIVLNILEWKGRKYAIRDNEIVFLGANRTTTWHVEGIREKLMSESKELREEPQ